MLTTHPLSALPPTAMYSLRREIRSARRRVSVARTDSERMRAIAALTALRLAAYDVFTSGEVAS